MIDYCLNYRYRTDVWKQACTTFKAMDDEEAIRIVKAITQGVVVKDVWLIPYERMVKV